MQDADQAELSADKAGILSQMLCCRCRSTKEQVIDKVLVTASECAQGRGQGEGEHEIRDWQEKILLFLQPLLGLVVLAFWAVAVAAGVVAELGLVTLRAGIGLPAQGGCATLFDGVHGPSVTRE
jgi:hypothetical protein